MIHYFKTSLDGIQLPSRFTYPFQYTPHPLVLQAAEEVSAYLRTRTDWQEELSHGKMFGVLLVQTPDDQIGYLAAFSGNLAGSNHHSFFVPPVFDLLRPGDFFKVEESNISAINHRISAIVTSPAYKELKEEVRRAHEEADATLKEARGALKTAKKQRDAERKEISERLAQGAYFEATAALSRSEFSQEREQELTHAQEQERELTHEREQKLTHAQEQERELTHEREQELTHEWEQELTHEWEQDKEQGLTQEQKQEERQREANREQDEARLRALIGESQFQKAEFKRLERRIKEEVAEKDSQLQQTEDELTALKQERKTRSAALQLKLFEHFRMLNARGEVKDLCQIFEETRQSVPPAGAGECALPKMLHDAYLHQLHPLAFGEFWWGESPKDEIRRHGQFYPSCKGKCEPILKHMLVGLTVDANPLAADTYRDTPLPILYEDKWIVVVDKPAGMLSAPGKEAIDSVSERLQRMYPEATGPLLVHRLDMATSGLLVAAKTKEVHAQLQALFEARDIRKVYTAVLEGIPSQPSGCINLPLCLNPMDRPRQMVSYEHGKEAITYYKVLATKDNQSLVQFDLQTGRTHQIRMHAAHPQGLNCPIKGDELYGKGADRLYLHATEVEFVHPVTGQKMRLESEVPFKL